MNSKNRNKDHPEIKDIKNICDISPNLKETKDVCEKLKKEHSNDKDSSLEQKKKSNSPEDSANPGNQYLSKNKKPKNLEKKGFNNSPKPIK